MSKLIYAVLLINGNNEDKLFETVSCLKGCAASILYTVQLNNLAAVVCNIAAEDLVKDVPSILGYAHVIESLMKVFTLLPMRFGSIFDSTDQIFAMLLKNASKFQIKLKSLEDKYEFGLKIKFDSDKLKEDLTAKVGIQINDSEPISVKEESTIFRQYVEQKLVKHRLEEQYVAFKETVLSRLSEYLKPLNESFFFDKHGGSSNIIDTYMLMSHIKKEEIVDLVNSLQLEFPSISFTLTGPWPPYNFADITIK